MLKLQLAVDSGSHCRSKQQMTLSVNLADPLDVQVAVAILSQLLANKSEEATTVAPVPASPAAFLAQRFVDALWPHLGRSMRRLVKEAANLTNQKAMITIAELAAALGRPEKSVRASINGPLAIAIKNVRVTMVNAPRHLFIWQHNGAVYELGIPDEIRAALDTKAVL